jgi:3-phosphoshikimate 1-carboxyvinyltransferase
MQALELSKPDRTLRGEITLEGSKSISNRALIVLALAGADPTDWLEHLSASKDTVTLQRLLTQTGSDVYDAGDAGTTFRFMTARLCLQPGTQTLTGSHRMLERPIGALVTALRSLGADIEYLGQEGYPPLRIGPPDHFGKTSRQVRIHGGTSSQFLSALLMIGPCLPEGLELIPEGELVSRPYLEMTLQLMRYFGAQAEWQDDRIVVSPGNYTPKKFVVEADWSAASYWYALAALAESPDIRLNGLFADSWQGDAVLSKMMQSFGIQTIFEEKGIRIQATGAAPKPLFEWNFLECPDIAQTLAVVCAGLGVQGIFSGLETLSIKETDRIAAIRNELAKVGVSFSKLPPHFSKKSPGQTFFLVEGKAHWQAPPHFATYGDHRMAMAFAPLALLAPIVIEDPEVVRKSYGSFWEHLKAAGFQEGERVREVRE